MDVSFIVPAFNEDDYVADCVESILSQETDKDFEVIVVDNRSTDRTAEVAREAGASVVECPTRGIYAARNKGAREAGGGLLVFVDADTTLEPNYLEEVLAFLESHPDAVAVTVLFDFDSDSAQGKFVNGIFPNLVKVLSKINFCNLYGVAAAVKRDAFFEVGGFPAVPSEDAAMGEQLKKEGEVCILNETLAHTSSRRFDGDLMGTVLYYVHGKLSAFIRLMDRLPDRLKEKLVQESKDYYVEKR